LFVIKHNRRATRGARAQFERPVWVFIVEGLTFQTAGLIYFQVSVIKEDNVSALLPGNTLAHGAVAGVAIYRVFICMGVDMAAPSGILV
jgi:hypothetical protein